MKIGQSNYSERTREVCYICSLSHLQELTISGRNVHKKGRTKMTLPLLWSIGNISTLLTYNSDTILASERIFNPFLGIRVIIPDSINPKTVFIPSR